MERSELYSKIDNCGVMPYQYMVYLLNNSHFDNPSIPALLISRLKSTGRLSQSDWILFIEQVTWEENTIPREVALQYVIKCKLNRWEFVQILENIQFTDETNPVYLMTENNQFIIKE